MRIVPTLFAVLAAASAAAQSPPSWTEPVEPFRVVGNIHYVGTAELASFLVTTPEGHILLDAPMEENVPHLLASIRKLGFEPKDVRILINSHAHFDHAGGFRTMREMTGARLLLSAEDAALAARGGTGDFAFGDRFHYAPVEADAILEDGERVSLGGTTLTALITPGHTKGGTSWTTTVREGSRTLRVVIANSMTAPDYRLWENEHYPNVMEDFRASFARLRRLEADVFLAPHASFFGLRRKMAARGGATNPFIDPAALRAYTDRMEAAVERRYRSQREAARVESVLDALHDAAAKADGARYFALFDPSAVYIGTDATERWTLEEFRAFAEPYFGEGRGWTYVPTARHVTIGPDEKTAWFDEILENASYGTTRGTGVLVRNGEEWKIAQYHLTIPVPNDLARRVVAMIRAENPAR